MQVDGIPDGYELVRIGRPIDGEWVIGWQGNAFVWGGGQSEAANHVILRKVERPKQYRPFANAEEFEPHRNRWWRLKQPSGSADFNTKHPPAAYNDTACGGVTWKSAFERREFEDGTPFGVEVIE